MVEKHPLNPESNQPQEKLKYTAQELLIAKIITQNVIKDVTAMAGTLKLEDLDNNLQAGVRADNEAAMLVGLEYALGKHSGIYYEHLDMAIHEELSLVLDEQLEGKKPSIDLFDGAKKIRPLEEIVEAQQILRRKQDETGRSHPNHALNDDINLRKKIIRDPRIGALWELEGHKGELEALNFILGDDNQISKVVKEFRNAK